MKGHLAILFTALLFALMGPNPSFGQGQEALQKLGLAPEPDPHPAPRFLSTTVDGKKIGSDEIKGKLVLLNFWATWCPPCRLEMPSMERLYKEFKGDGLEIVAVNFMESEKPIRSFLKENGFTFPVLFDKKGEIAQSYGVHALPVTFLIGRNGNLLAKSMGYKDWHAEKMRHFFKSLLKNEGMISQPLRANPMVVSNEGRMERRWLIPGIGVLIFGLAVFFLWIRKARLQKEQNL